MFVLLQMIMLIGVTESATDLTTTYQRIDPLTGRTLTCQRCPPGSHMLRHCSGSEQTRCAPCPSQHYTQYWNYLSRCLFCNVVCEENQVVKEECSRFHDRICECADGYYMHSGVCRRHTECPSGQGVKEKGTVQKDTVCEECAQGSYSSRSSEGDTCVKHTDCESLGLRTVLEGTLWYDSLCASCQYLEAGGGLEALRDVLPDFFRHQKMKQKNFRRFVRLCIRNEVNGTLAGLRTVQLRQDPRGCLDRWLREVEAEKLKKLPVMLKKSNLQHVAYKLENKLHKKPKLQPVEMDHCYCVYQDHRQVKVCLLLRRRMQGDRGTLTWGLMLHSTLTETAVTLALGETVRSKAAEKQTSTVLQRNSGKTQEENGRFKQHGSWKTM